MEHETSPFSLRRQIYANRTTRFKSLNNAAAQSPTTRSIRKQILTVLNGRTIAILSNGSVRIGNGKRESFLIMCIFIANVWI